jgi:phosphorylcholine metabolism protein LicD
VGDLIGARVFYSDEDLRIYPIVVDKILVRGVFVDIAKTAQDLELNPKFYNTITSNCTNVLAVSANKVKEGSVLWNKARILTGYADNHLYDLGYIKNDEPFEKVYEKARVDLFLREKFLGKENYTNEEFWKEVRGAGEQITNNL